MTKKTQDEEGKPEKEERREIKTGQKRGNVKKEEKGKELNKRQGNISDLE